MLLNSEIAGKFLRYFFSGTLSVLVHLSILAFLVEAFRMDKIYATSTGFVLGSVVNYLLQYTWVFSSKERHLRAFAFYFGFALLMLFVNAWIFSFFLSFLRLHYLVSQALATGIVFLLNFLCNLTITFRSSSRPSPINPSPGRPL